jgi:site-specific DNA-methyltransferase (adenine-specific)
MMNGDMVENLSMKMVFDFMEKLQLLHGDCLDLMKQIPDGFVDMILCDLPYGTTSCKWDSIIPFDLLWDQYKRICKPNSAIVLTATQPFTSSLVMSNMKMFKHQWIWEKDKSGNFAAARFQPMKNFEDVLVFCISSPRYFPQVTKREKPITRGNSSDIGGDKNKKSSIQFGKHIKKTFHYKQPTAIIKGIGVVRKTSHPTQKPVELMEYLIKTYSQKGDIVLDNCMGSGTTGVACMNTERKFIGIEKDEEYFQIAKKRISNLIVDDAEDSWQSLPI